MTIELTRGGQTLTVSWKSPVMGLWVASHDGEFLGMVEDRAGRYLATDALGREIAAFDVFTAARAAVENQGDSPAKNRRELLVMKATICLSSAAALALLYWMALLTR